MLSYVLLLLPSAALTMTTNIITPAILIFNVVMSYFPERFDASLGPEQAANREAVLDTTQYLVSASLICSGITTFFQVSRIRIPFTRFQIGTGILSVMGTANQYNAVFPVIMFDIISRGYSFDEAWGKLLGTIMICVWLEGLISFLPPKVLKRVFPPFVLGVTVFLIGVQLTAAGMRFWGGGVGCSANPIPENLCPGNGDVKLAYGSGPYIGLGFSVFFIFLLVEVFGSPFLRNTMVIWGLLGGYLIASIATYDGKKFVTTTRMNNAPAFTFIWVKTFPIGVHGPAIIPLLFAFMVTAMETMGDVTATELASRLRPKGDDHNKRIQGGVLGDCVATLFAALGTTSPNTTLSQNNGIVALTRCASTSAGYACGLWLMLFGIIAKIAAWILSIPDCVLGGALAFLFCTVAASGIKLINLERMDRRTLFIVAMSLTLGLGTALVPAWSAPGLGAAAAKPNQWWPYSPGMSVALDSLRVGLMVAINTPYFIGSISAILLHLLIPIDLIDDVEIDTEEGWRQLDLEEASVARSLRSEDDSTIKASSAYRATLEKRDSEVEAHT